MPPTRQRCVTVGYCKIKIRVNLSCFIIPLNLKRLPAHMSATAFCFLLIHHIYRFALDERSEIFFNYSDEPRPRLESRPGDVRGYQAIFASEQRIAFFRRLGRERTSTPAPDILPDFSASASACSSTTVSARGVDEKCVRLHLRNKLGVYKPGCLRSQRAVESHKVRLLSSSSISTNLTAPSQSPTFAERELASTSMPKAPAILATALPILP